MLQINIKCVRMSDVVIQLQRCGACHHIVPSLRTYIPHCIYIVQMIKSTHFKRLAKAFSYPVTHIFRLYNFHLLDLKPHYMKGNNNDLFHGNLCFTILGCLSLNNGPLI
jgi:hypothetical protein